MLGFILSIVLFATPAFSADYYGQQQDVFDVPMGISIGLSGNFGGCTGDCGESIEPGGGIGINIAFRPSMSFGVYLEAMKNFVHPAEGDVDNINFSFIQANLGVNFYLFPASKFQPLVTAGFGYFHMAAEDDDGNVFMEEKEQQSVFFGIGAEYIISRNMTIPFKLQYSKIILNDGNTEKDSLWNILVGFNYYF